RERPSPPAMSDPHQIEEDPFPDPAIGDAQPADRPGRANRVEDRAAAQHQIGALAADTGTGSASGEVEACQMGRNHRDLLEGQHPKRKRYRAENLRPPPVAASPQPQPYDLGRAPTDIEHDRVGNARIEQWSAAGDDEPRLFGARDDFDLDADFFVHPGEERL